MGISFLTPLILGGFALLSVPWLIHQIRKPERDLMIFSSLMFIPTIKRKIIERRSLQHILLMLLRMAIFALLFLSFARPFRLLIADEETAFNQTRHVIMLDCSLSMSAEEKFSHAKEATLRLLESFTPNDRVGLISFHQHINTIEPLFIRGESFAQNIERIRFAIADATVSPFPTAYITALQKAEDLLFSNPPSEDESPTYIIHILSDLQAFPLQSQNAVWKLSSAIQVSPVRFGTGEENQLSIQEVAIRETSDNHLHIVAQIRNHVLTEEVQQEVLLFLDGERIAGQEIQVQAGHSSKVSFTIPADLSAIHTGYVTTGHDGFPTDDRRYFAWNPQRKNQILLIANRDSNQPWSSDWFIEKALHIKHNKRWDIVTASVQNAIQSINLPGKKPDILICTNMGTFSPAVGDALSQYLRDGGNVIFFADHDTPDLFLEQLGLSRNASMAREETQRTILSWTDFTHPVFSPFNGSRYNDFSFIQFNDVLQVNPVEPSRSEISMIASFENNVPAGLEIRQKNSTLLLWAFTPDTAHTTLPKSPKFIPLLFEMLNHLSTDQTQTSSILAGEPVIYPTVPDLENAVPFLEEEPITLTDNIAPSPGILTYRINDETVYAVPVNTDRRESDFSFLTEESFIQTFASNPETAANTQDFTSTLLADHESVIKYEYGYYGLWAVLAFLIFESIYASRLARTAIQKEKTQ
jgi:hypothetical protein